MLWRLMTFGLLLGFGCENPVKSPLYKSTVMEYDLVRVWSQVQFVEDTLDGAISKAADIRLFLTHVSTSSFHLDSSAQGTRMEVTLNDSTNVSWYSPLFLPAENTMFSRTLAPAETVVYKDRWRLRKENGSYFPAGNYTIKGTLCDYRISDLSVTVRY